RLFSPAPLPGLFLVTRAYPDKRAISGKTVCQSQNGVVRAHVAVHRDAVETVCRRLAQTLAERQRRNQHVGRDEAEHRGMKRHRGRTSATDTQAGLNHAGAFANSADADRLAAELE